mgnify:CR=1 FL=1
MTLEEMRDYFISDDVLNIFTDASIKRIRNENSFIGCPGIISYLGYQSLCKRLEMINFSTNNESEIRAIQMAVEYIYECIPMLPFIKRINIFSDSRISVYGLREWYKNWFNNFKNGELYGSSGKVKNQKYFIFIIKAIEQLGIPINIYHLRGHMENKPAYEFITSFYKENHIAGYHGQMNYELKNYLVHGNDEIDKETGVVDGIDVSNIVVPYKKEELVSPFNYTDLINSINLNVYEQLISGYNRI